MFLRLFVFFHDIFGTQIRSQLGFPALRLPDLRFRFFQLTLSSNDSNSGLNWSCVINRRIGIVAVGGTQRSRAFTARQEIVWDLSGSISYFFPKLSSPVAPPGDMLWHVKSHLPQQCVIDSELVKVNKKDSAPNERHSLEQLTWRRLCFLVRIPGAVDVVLFLLSTDITGIVPVVLSVLFRAGG